MTETRWRGSAFMTCVAIIGVACADGDEVPNPGLSAGGVGSAFVGGEAGERAVNAGQSSQLGGGGSTGGDAPVAPDAGNAGQPSEKIGGGAHASSLCA
jgi:hypothetical protein